MASAATQVRQSSPQFRPVQLVIPPPPVAAGELSSGYVSGARINPPGLPPAGPVRCPARPRAGARPAAGAGPPGARAGCPEREPVHRLRGRVRHPRGSCSGSRPPGGAGLPGTTSFRLLISGPFRRKRNVRTKRKTAIPRPEETGIHSLRRLRLTAIGCQSTVPPETSRRRTASGQRAVTHAKEDQQ